MKTAFLKGLGLEKDVIDQIMAENGKDIELEKSKAKEVQTELDKANETIKARDKQLEALKNSPDNPETLKQQIQQLQDENKASKEAHEKEMKELKVSTALEKALSDAKAKNAKAVQALLDLGDDVELADDGTIKGLDDKIKALKKSDAYLFDDTKPSTTIKGANPANTNPNNPTDPGSKKPQEKSYEDFVAELEAESNAN
ncbi:phage scaffolding protein [Amedibacterium intestinale]|uniref:phage scaffolding protein n=1 Tax=Amedibacterium intestinale TaxID=2583452 RepID=UPI000E20A921